MELGLDGHKLHYHPERVAAVLAGGEPGPIYVELGLTKRCNLRCTFCALDFLQTPHSELPTERLLALFGELAETGVKSLLFSGDGEPMLRPELPDLIAAAAACGLDTALATNGTQLPAEWRVPLARHLTWIKFSLNAATRESYARIHRADGALLDRALANLEALVATRNALTTRMTIGVQAVLLPENAAEMGLLAERARAAGADYFVVKPFSRNPHSLAVAYPELDYRPYLKLGETLRQLATDRFQVCFRDRAIGKTMGEDRGYGGCLGAAFVAAIYADGGVFPCAPHSGDQSSCYGNVNRHSFGEIWHSARRRAIGARLAADLAGCMPGCRMDEINRYLWRLRHPPPHVNFI